VDENGVTHYGERPPQKQKAQAVTTRPATAPAPDASPAKPPDNTDLQQKNIEFQKRRIAREEKAEKELKEAQEKRERCNFARDDLRRMEAADRLYDLNEKGERVYVDDATRNATIERARRYVERSCS
jgi:hypothetical protein